MKRVSLNKVMAKLAVEQTPEQEFKLAQESAVRDAEAIYSRARNEIGGILMGAAQDINKYTQDIYIKTQEVENTINRVEKVQKEVGEDFGVIPKWKNELKEIERYFKQLSDWQDKIKSIQKPSR